MTIELRESADGGLDYIAVGVAFLHVAPGAPEPSTLAVAHAMGTVVEEMRVVMALLCFDVTRAAWYAASPGLEAAVAAALGKVRK